MYIYICIYILPPLGRKDDYGLWPRHSCSQPYPMCLLTFLRFVRRAVGPPGYPHTASLKNLLNELYCISPQTPPLLRSVSGGSDGNDFQYRASRLMHRSRVRAAVPRSVFSSYSLRLDAHSLRLSAYSLRRTRTHPPTTHHHHPMQYNSFRFFCSLCRVWHSWWSHSPSHKSKKSEKHHGVGLRAAVPGL